MAIGERIHFFRNLRGMTQKYLGLRIGFPENSADVRMAQYETGTRTPKSNLTEALADTLDVAPEALNVPDIDSHIGLMHTLFALEDIYGITVDEKAEDICLKIDSEKSAELCEMLSAWKEQKEKLVSGKIDKETYDQWRYHFPKYDEAENWAKVPSKNFSDSMAKAFRNLIKPD